MVALAKDNIWTYPNLQGLVILPYRLCHPHAFEGSGAFQRQPPVLLGGAIRDKTATVCPPTAISASVFASASAGWINPSSLHQQGPQPPFLSSTDSWKADPQSLPHTIPRPPKTRRCRIFGSFSSPPLPPGSARGDTGDTVSACGRGRAQAHTSSTSLYTRSR